MEQENKAHSHLPLSWSGAKEEVFLGLGTNLGNKEQNILLAVQEIEERIGKVISLSALYVTAPWGFSSENSFLNAVLSVETSLPPLEVLAITQEIERCLGRAHKSVDGVYSDRLIDIDLLMYGDLLLDMPQLQLPHPLMHQRRFVMEPLAEIASYRIHPVLGKTMGELMQELSSGDIPL